MKILCTGVTGYVGSFLREALSSEGEVVGMCRGTAPPLDFTDAEACAALLDELKPDVVVHAGALSNPSECEREPDRAWAVNAPRGFVEAAAAAALRPGAPARRFVFFSTDQVHDGRGHLVSEAVEAKPVNVYGQTKLAMERLVQQAFPGDRHAVLRLSFVYGPEVPGAHGTFLQFALGKLRAGAPFSAFTDQVRSAVYIEDVVEAVRLAVRGGLSGVVNVGGPQALSRYDFCRGTAEVCGFAPELVGGNSSADVPGLPPSPADISMDTGKLAAALGRPLRSLAIALHAMDLAGSEFEKSGANEL